MKPHNSEMILNDSIFTDLTPNWFPDSGDQFLDFLPVAKVLSILGRIIGSGTTLEKAVCKWDTGSQSSKGIQQLRSEVVT